MKKIKKIAILVLTGSLGITPLLISSCSQTANSAAQPTVNKEPEENKNRNVKENLQCSANSVLTYKDTGERADPKTAGYHCHGPDIASNAAHGH